MAFKWLVFPTIDYASAVWEPFTTRNISISEKLRNKAVRFIYTSYKSTDSVTALKSRASLNSVQTRLVINRMKLFFQILKECNKIYISKYITILKPILQRTKNNRYIQRYWCSKDRFKYSFIVRCIDEWNKLQSCVVNSKDFVSFTKELDIFYASIYDPYCLLHKFCTTPALA